MTVTIRRASDGRYSIRIVHRGITINLTDGVHPATSAGAQAAIAAVGGQLRAELRAHVLAGRLADFQQASEFTAQLSAARRNPRITGPGAPARAARPARAATPPPAQRDAAPPPRRATPRPAARPRPAPRPTPPPARRAARPPPAINMSFLQARMRSAAAGGTGSGTAITQIESRISDIDSFLSTPRRRQEALALIFNTLRSVTRFRLYGQSVVAMRPIIAQLNAGTVTHAHFESLEAQAVQFLNDYFTREAARTGTTPAAVAARQFGTEARGIAPTMPTSMDARMLAVAGLYIRRMEHQSIDAWTATAQPPIIMTEFVPERTAVRPTPPAQPVREQTPPRPAGTRRRALMLGDFSMRELQGGPRISFDSIVTPFREARPGISLDEDDIYGFNTVPTLSLLRFLRGELVQGISRRANRRQYDRERVMVAPRREFGERIEAMSSTTTPHTDIFIQAGANDIGDVRERGRRGEAVYTAYLERTAGRIIQNLREMYEYAHTTLGLDVVAVTIPPMWGYRGWSEEKERVRDMVNSWIRGGSITLEGERIDPIPAHVRLVDLDPVLMAEPGSGMGEGRRLRSGLGVNSGNLSAAGRRAVFQAYAERGFQPRAVTPPATEETDADQVVTTVGDEEEGRRILAEEQRRYDARRASALPILQELRGDPLIDEEDLEVIADMEHEPEGVSRASVMSRLRSRVVRQRPASFAPHRRRTTRAGTGTSAEGRAFFIGDSLTAGLAGANSDLDAEGSRVHGLRRSLREGWSRPQVEVRVAGFSGNGVSRILRHMRTYPDLRREIANCTEIFIEAGANSLGMRRHHAAYRRLQATRRALDRADPDDRPALQRRVQEQEERLDQAVERRVAMITGQLRLMYEEARSLRSDITIIGVGLPPLFGYNGCGVLEERVRMGVNAWIEEHAEAGDIPGLERFVDLDARMMQDPTSTDPTDTMMVGGRRVSSRRVNPEYSGDGVHYNPTGMPIHLEAYAVDGYPPIREAVPRPTPPPAQVTTPPRPQPVRRTTGGRGRL